MGLPEPPVIPGSDLLLQSEFQIYAMPLLHLVTNLKKNSTLEEYTSSAKINYSTNEKRLAAHMRRRITAMLWSNTPTKLVTPSNCNISNIAACGCLHHVAVTFEATLAKRAAILICIGKSVSLSGQGSFKWDSWQHSGPDFTSGLDVEECAISGLCMGRAVTSRRRNLPINGLNFA